MKKSVLIIGNYLNGLIKYLKQNNIHCDEVIDSCSPLAMAGQSNQSYYNLSEDIETPMLTVLNIKKNLTQMLSHDEKNFCSNYNLQPLGKEVRKKNSADYIIVMNSFAICPLYEKKGVVYSELWQDSEFIRSIHNDNSFIKRTFPFDEDFNWKFYYMKFIDAVKSEYDRKHIIFIKCNCAAWYMNEHDIKAFDAVRSMRFRNMIEEIDNYFIENTHCIVIDEHFSHIPPKADSMRQFPYILMSDYTSNKIGEKIVDAINESSKIETPMVQKSSCRLCERLFNRLSSDILNKNRNFISEIENEWLSVNDLKNPEYGEKSEFYSDLAKLDYFIGGEYEHTLSNYALMIIPLIKKGERKLNVELMELYTRYFRLDINDAIAAYMMFEYSAGQKRKFKGIAENFLRNSNFVPLKSAERLLEKNIDFLKGYPYLKIDIPEIAEQNKAYIMLENNSMLVIDPGSENVFSKVDDIFKNDFDYKQILDNGLCCPIEYADALTYSYEYYTEKARRGCGDKPTYLKFESISSFLDTLNYIDYSALLSNEKFVFSFSESDLKVPPDFVPSVDFTVFMDPDTVIVRVQNGLADQICHYMLGQAISELTKRRVIYYDLSCADFNGCELRKFAKKEIEIFSDKISRRLSLIGNDPTMKYIRKINDYTLVTDNGYFESMFKKIWWETAGYICRDLKKYLNTRLPYSYYYRLIGLHNLVSVFPCELSDYIEFPPFLKEEHKNISDEMQSCDAVVIHVRRGDIVTVGWDTDCDYYIEAIQRLLSFTQYENKKYFVFSDDIQWCKEHCDEIGLSLIKNSKIYFMEGNSFDESFRDIQLMSLGKIMIIGDSNFSRTAAMLNKNCEIMYCGNKKFFDTYQQYVRKNKYNEDVYPFSKDYSRPYVYMKPKKLSQHE